MSSNLFKIIFLNQDSYELNLLVSKNKVDEKIIKYRKMLLYINGYGD